MKYLIVNADDFGMSREINDGIKKGIEGGIITSVSVMVNMPFSDDAISYLKKHPEVSVGLHFNITEGSPISERQNATTLIREDNSFFYWTSMIMYLVFRKVSIKEIENELRAQYKKLHNSNIKISHIDSHHHIHLFPTIFKIVLNFSQKNNIQSIRYRGFNPRLLPFWIQNFPSLKQYIIIGLCILNGFLFVKKKKIQEIDSLFDISWDSSFNERRFIKYLQTLPNGTTEIICHPALLSTSGNPKFLEPRYKGLSMLLSKKVGIVIKNSNLILISKAK